MRDGSIVYDDDKEQLSASVNKMKKVCGVIKVLCVISLVLVAAVYLVGVAVMILFNQNNAQSQVGLVEFIYHISEGVLVFLLMFMFMRVFSDVVAGDSPFTMKQVRRLRIAGSLFLAFALLQLFLPLGYLFSTSFQSVNVSFESTEYGQLMPTIKLSVFFASFICYGIAIVFKYGIQLQQLSDDTL
jgi:cytochrome b561